MKYGLVASLASLVAVASAATITVQVGQGGDVFVPTNVMAASGDIIDFVFHDDEHSVIESAGTTASTACQPMAGGFATEIMPNGSTYMLPVNNTDPVYIHCGPHCKSAGMIFVINPPSQQAVTNFMDTAEGIAVTSSMSMAAASSTSAASTASSSSSTMNGVASLSMPSFTIIGALTAFAFLGSAILL